MRRLYEKDRIRHFLVWLAFYLGVSIVAINLGSALGVGEHAAAAVPLAVLAVAMAVHLRRSGIGPQIGLGVPPAVPAARMWFYLPLAVLALLPLLGGVREDLALGFAIAMTAHYVAAGFLEEVLFRGLLLRALLREWRPVWAVLLSAATFGVGHVANLLIGQSGADTVGQIINAAVVGLIFTLVVVATGDLRAVIVAHILHNIVARLSQGIDTIQLIVAGLMVLAVYGTWLLYGAGVRDRLKDPDPAATARRSA